MALNVPRLDTVSLTRLLAAAALGAALSACATKPPASEPEALAAFEETNDKMEPFNRTMFAVDQAVDAVVIRPIAWTYREFIPEPARNGVTNILRNLREPITFANDLLQGEGKRATNTFGRFALNSTVGVLGLFDVSGRAGIPYHTEDFGQTLAVWGVEEGPYLYLPVFGPTSFRDGPGYVVDNLAFDPVSWYSYNNKNPQWVQWAYLGALVLDTKANTMSVTDELNASSIDYYAALRSAWRQNRLRQIHNGAPATPQLDGESDPFAFPDDDDKPAPPS